MLQTDLIDSYVTRLGSSFRHAKKSHCGGGRAVTGQTSQIGS